MWCATPCSPVCVVAPSTTATAVPDATPHTCADDGVTAVDDRRQFRQNLGRAEFIAGILDRLCGRDGAEVTFDLAFAVGEILQIDDDVALSRLTVATALAEADAATLAELDRAIVETPEVATVATHSAVHHARSLDEFRFLVEVQWTAARDEGLFDAAELCAHQIEVLDKLNDAVFAVSQFLDADNAARRAAGHPTLHPDIERLTEQAVSLAVPGVVLHPRLLALVAEEFAALDHPQGQEVRHAV